MPPWPWVFLHIIIAEKLYDQDFLETFTDGPRLIREDTGKLLRESHLSKDGSKDNFVVFDQKTKRWPYGIQSFQEYRPETPSRP